MKYYTHLVCCLLTGMIALGLLSACVSQTPTQIPTKTVAPSRIIPSLTPTVIPTRILPTSTLAEDMVTKHATESSATSFPSTTPIFTPFPTYAPATALPGPENYSLAKWSPQSASELVALMESSVSDDMIEPDNSDNDAVAQYEMNMNQSSEVLETIYKELLLRAPQHLQANDWWPRLIYAQTISSGNDVGETLAGFLESQLAQGVVTFEKMEAWFTNRFDKPAGYLFPLLPTMEKVHLPPSSVADSYLLSIQNADFGGACLLLRKTDEGFQIHSLASGFIFYMFPIHLRIGCHLVDLTGDGIDEVVIDSNFGGRLTSEYFEVYSLDQWPPRQLPLDPEINRVNQASWPGLYYLHDIEEEPAGIRFIFAVDIPFECSIISDVQYRWNSFWFEPVKLDLWDNSDFNVPDCVDYLARILDRIPAEIQLVLWEKMLDAQPENDQVRHHLGLQQAMQGDFETSHQTLRSLVEAPGDPHEPWTWEAQQFLTNFIDPEKLYYACQYASECSLRQAVIGLARQIPTELLLTAPQRLIDARVPILSSGALPTLEVMWFTIHFPESDKPELWLLVPSEGYLDAVMAVELPDDNLPTEVTLLDSSDGFLHFTAGDRMEFLFSENGMWGHLYVEQVIGNKMEDGSLQDLQVALLEGKDAAAIFADMEKLSQDIDFDPRALYLYGLAAELSGQEKKAVQIYWQLWSEFPQSQFSILARYKLSGIP